MEIDGEMLRPADVDTLRAAADKAARVLGWRPKVSLEQLVSMMVDADVEEVSRELAGARHTNPRDDYPFTARSLVPLLRGENSKELHERYRRRDLLLSTHFDMLGVMSEFRHKLICERPSGTYLLFDLYDDPKEMHNLVYERPELVEEMMDKLRTLLRRHPSYMWRIKAPDE